MFSLYKRSVGLDLIVFLEVSNFYILKIFLPFYNASPSKIMSVTTICGKSQFDEALNSNAPVIAHFHSEYNPKSCLLEYAFANLAAHQKKAKFLKVFSFPFL